MLEPESIAIYMLLIILALIILVLASSPTLNCNNTLMSQKPKTLLLQFLNDHRNIQIFLCLGSPPELGVSRLYFFMVGDSQNLSPFQASPKLLIVYDHESEEGEPMISSSEKRGAKVLSAEFKWPRLRIQSAKLRKMTLRRRKRKKKRDFLFSQFILE